jgi:hypothetical protein
LVGTVVSTQEQGFFTGKLKEKRRGNITDFLSSLNTINTTLRDHGSNIRVMATVKQMKKFGFNLGSGLGELTRPRILPNFLYLSRDDVDRDYVNMLGRYETFLEDLTPNAAAKSLLEGTLPPPGVLSKISMKDTQTEVYRKCNSTPYADFVPLFKKLKEGKINSCQLAKGWSCRKGADNKLTWLSPGCGESKTLEAKMFEDNVNAIFPIEGTFNYNTDIYQVGEATIQDKDVYLCVHDGKLSISSAAKATSSHLLTEKIARQVINGVNIGSHVISRNTNNDKFFSLCENHLKEHEERKQLQAITQIKAKLEKSDISAQDKTRLTQKLSSLEAVTPSVPVSSASPEEPQHQKIGGMAFFDRGKKP